MSRLTRAASTMHTLSLAAMEEASRFGVRDADVDHLLLALTIDADAGGQVLRGMGIGLDAARQAVAEQHAAQLDLVGVSSGGPGPDRIVFHETSGYDWTDRAIDVLKQANSKGLRGDSAAVLSTLLDEPSGLIHAILRRLDVDPAVLRSRLDDAQRLGPADGRAPEATTISGTRTIFIPAALDDVWALLSSPSRIPEWDQSIAEIDAHETATRTWAARTRTTAPDGTPISVKPAFLRQQVRLVRCEHPVAVGWRFTRPDATHSNPRRVDFDLEHAAGGTQARVTLAWEASGAGGARRVVRALLRPVHRFLVFIQLAQLESAVGRVFR